MHRCTLTLALSLSLSVSVPYSAFFGFRDRASLLNPLSPFTPKHEPMMRAGRKVLSSCHSSRLTSPPTPPLAPSAQMLPQGSNLGALMIRNGFEGWVHVHMYTHTYIYIYIYLCVCVSIIIIRNCQEPDGIVLHNNIGQGLRPM